MNKIAFSLAIPDEQKCNALLPMIKDAGFDGFEPTLTPQGGLPNLEEPEASAERLKAKADALGLEIPSMRGGPSFWPLFASPKEADRNKAIDVADKALKAVKTMGGSALLVVPGRIQESKDYEAAIGWATDSAKRVAELAEKADILACMENVANGLFVSPLDMRALIDNVDSPWVKSYFDVGNCLYMGQGFPEDWLKILGERVGRIHFKDATQWGEVRHLLVGDVDWPAVAAAMRDIEYKAYVSVELNPYKLAPKRMLEETYKNTKLILGM